MADGFPEPVGSAPWCLIAPGSDSPKKQFKRYYELLRSVHRCENYVCVPNADHTKLVLTFSIWNVGGTNTDVLTVKTSGKLSDNTKSRVFAKAMLRVRSVYDSMECALKISYSARATAFHHEMTRAALDIGRPFADVLTMATSRHFLSAEMRLALLHGALWRLFKEARGYDQEVDQYNHDYRLPTYAFSSNGSIGYVQCYIFSADDNIRRSSLACKVYPRAPYEDIAEFAIAFISKQAVSVFSGPNKPKDRIPLIVDPKYVASAVQSAAYKQDDACSTAHPIQ